MAMPTNIITTIMTDPSALTAATRLAYWLSPAFPTGAFAYSHGLEYAFEADLISNRDDFQNWLSAIVTSGSGWADAVFCSLSWRADGDAKALRNLSNFACAMASSAERLQETQGQGDAFQAAAGQWAEVRALPKGTPIAICVGAATRACGMDHHQTLTTYLSSFLTNLIQAALRMGRFGQADGVALIAALESTLLATALAASTARQDDIDTNTLLADIAAISHETQEPRIFLS